MSDFDRQYKTGIFQTGHMPRRPRQDLGALEEPARAVPVLRDCDVLVVGGGPSGTAAAIAAGRMGADVVLLERANHLGGLSTGGLVIWIDRMTDWSGQQVITGLANDLLDRLPKDAVAGPPRDSWGSRDDATAAYWRERTAAFHGVVTWSPTIDPEHLKFVSQEMVLENNVTLLLHAWVAAPIMREGPTGGSVGGVFLETKEGRMAIRAAVTIDCTGDGDIFHRAGAAEVTDVDRGDIHHCVNTAWLFGGVDMPRFIDFKTGQPEAFGDFTKHGTEACGGVFGRPFVSWRDDVAVFMGPRLSGYSAVNIEDQTEVEIRSRRLMLRHLEVYRANAPGFENAYLMLSAPQLGVRHARRLVGVDTVTRADWTAGTPRADEIGISPASSPNFPNISVPYGCLVPAEMDGLLVAGRAVSCDATTHSFLREVPQCWMTGQAAGVAAALAASGHTQPRDVPIPALQAELLRQGVMLRRHRLFLASTAQAP